MLNIICIQSIQLLKWFILIRFDQEDAKVVDLTDKMWLVKELERMRMFILDDLITVKVDNCSNFWIGGLLWDVIFGV